MLSFRMPNPEGEKMVRMTMIRPVLASKDLNKTRHFYENILNFRKAFQDPQGDNPTLIEFEYDACKVLFWKSDDDAALPGSLEFFVSDIKQFHQEASKNLSALIPINDYHGGAKCIEIEDPNGYRLTFVEPNERYKKFFGFG